MTAIPLLPVCFFVILIFTVMTALNRDDPVGSKPWEAVCGVLCPIISLGAAFGLLFYCGVHLLPIVTVVPFLVLAIGVDDVYIALHAWANTDKSLSVERRMAETLAEAGPSITITSLTNAVSFAIGILRYCRTYSN